MAGDTQCTAQGGIPRPQWRVIILSSLGVAVSFNLAFSVFSGPAALAAAALVRVLDSPTGPAWYMCGCAAVTFIGSLFLYRYDGRVLGDQKAEPATVRPSASPAHRWTLDVTQSSAELLQRKGLP